MYRSHGSTTVCSYVSNKLREQRPIISIHQTLRGIQQWFLNFIWSYLFGVFPVQTYKAFLPAMIANNHGHLVSIASSAGLIGVNGLAGVGFITTSNIISFPENQLFSASQTAA